MPKSSTYGIPSKIGYFVPMDTWRTRLESRDKDDSFYIKDKLVDRKHWNYVDRRGKRPIWIQNSGAVYEKDYKKSYHPINHLNRTHYNYNSGALPATYMWSENKEYVHNPLIIDQASIQTQENIPVQTYTQNVVDGALGFCPEPDYN